jgi:TolB-like protein
MSDETHEPVPVAAPEGEHSEKKKRKKKEKIRSAWISFVGRIIAQVLGAGATIFLGMYVVGKYSTARTAAVTPASAQNQTVVRRIAGTSVNAIAVLPLQNFSGDPAQDYVADSMTEAVIADLAQVEGLKVISRTSSMHYKGERKPLPQVARELAVDYIVEGSIVKAGEKLRITAQLIDAVRDEHVWARNYERDIRDMLALQSEVAGAIAREIAIAIPRARRAPDEPVAAPATYEQ